MESAGINISASPVSDNLRVNFNFWTTNAKQSGQVRQVPDLPAHDLRAYPHSAFLPHASTRTPDLSPFNWLFRARRNDGVKLRRDSVETLQLGLWEGGQMFAQGNLSMHITLRFRPSIAFFNLTCVAFK